MKNKKLINRKKRQDDINCFGERDKRHFPYNGLGLSKEDNSVSRTDNFVNVNVFRQCYSSSCTLLVLPLPVGLNFNLTFGLRPQVGGIKIVTVYKRSIFQVEWLIATLIPSQDDPETLNTLYNDQNTNFSCLLFFKIKNDDDSN